MSIATLKKKTIASWNLSGRGDEKFVINKSSPGNPVFSLLNNNIRETVSKFRVETGPGGGFSINGRHRNIGRVGQDMKMSKGLSRAVVISQGKNRFMKNKSASVPQYRGWGGTIGKYDKNGASGKFGIACCGESLKLVKPSVLSFKGMINLRNRWTSVNIPKGLLADLGDDGTARTKEGVLTLSCNNWVKNTGGNCNVETNTSQQYIDYTLKPKTIICNPNIYSDVPRPGQSMNTKYNCNPCSKPCRSCSYYIGTKYYPPTPYSKQITTSENSSYYNVIKIAKDGVLPNNGLFAPYPASSTNQQCGISNSNLLDVLSTKIKEQEQILKEKRGNLYACNKEFINRYKIILAERGSTGTLSSIAF